MTLLTWAACAPPTVITRGVPNLHAVRPGVWRGGQPTAAGWAYLREPGVKHVLKLNFDSYREMRMRGFHPELLGLVKAWDDYQPRR